MTKSLVYACAPKARTSLLALSKKENEPENNLTNSDFECITSQYFIDDENSLDSVYCIPIVDGDALEKTFSICSMSNSMDFAFIVNANEAFLGEMKFNVDRSVHGQLKNLLDKFKGTYRNLYSMVNGHFYNKSIVLFNKNCYEEAKNVLSRLDESFQEDSLVQSLRLHFKAETLPSFMGLFF